MMFLQFFHDGNLNRLFQHYFLIQMYIYFKVMGKTQNRRVKKYVHLIERQESKYQEVPQMLLKFPLYS